MIRGPRSTIFDFPEIDNIGFCTTGMAVLNCAGVEGAKWSALVQALCCYSAASLVCAGRHCVGVECVAWPALLVFPGALLLQCSVLCMCVSVNLGLRRQRINNELAMQCILF
jgi:hypothetical protein